MPGLDYPEGRLVFAVVADFVFAKDAVVPRVLSRHHYRADSNDASAIPWRHRAQLFVLV